MLFENRILVQGAVAPTNTDLSAFSRNSSTKIMRVSLHHQLNTREEVWFFVPYYSQVSMYLRMYLLILNTLQVLWLIMPVDVTTKHW